MKREYTAEQMQTILNYGNIDIEIMLKAAEERRREEFLTEKGIKIPKITKKPDRELYYCNIPGKYTEDGKRHQVTGSTEEECQEKYREEVYEFLRRQAEPPRTFASTYREWLDNKKSSIKGSTYSRYKRMDINYVQNSEFGAKRLADIRLPECEAFIGTLYKLNLGVENLKQVKSTLSQTLDYAIAHEYEGAKGNYFRSIKINANLCSTDHEHKKDAWTDEELALITEKSLEFWKEEQKYLYSAAYPILIYTGMRIGELLALEWKDVDFKEKKARINKSVARYTNYETGKKILAVGSTKTFNSKRIISLTDEAIRWLYELRLRNFATGRTKSGRVLETEGGLIVKSDKINDTMKRMCAEIGIEYRSSHACRRTYASVLLEAGILLPEVSADLGHKNLSTTQNSYYKRRNHADEQLKKKNAVFSVHSCPQHQNGLNPVNMPVQAS